MSGASEIIRHKQEVHVWEHLHPFSELPGWLVDIRDSELIRQAINRAVPEFTSGRWALKRVLPNHVRLQKGAWMGLYKLFYSVMGETQDRDITLTGQLFPPGSSTPPLTDEAVPFGAAGWHVYLPELGLNLVLKETETRLTNLKLLTDPEEACRFLEENIRQGSSAYRDIEIKNCLPKVVRYNPDSRCTVLYHLEYPLGNGAARHWPEIVVAKTYRGDKGQRAYDSMSALWHSPLGSSETVAIAEPLAYRPDMKILIQGPIRQEKILKDLIRETIESKTPEAIAVLKAYIAKTAAGLAELHRSGVTLGQTWTWKDEVGDVHEPLDSLLEAIPELRQISTLLLERLSAREASTAAGAAVPTHGTFRPAQVLLHQGQIGFIDFDSFRQAEPAMDLALFLATLKNIGLTQSDDEDDSETYTPFDAETRQEKMEFLEGLCSSFLDEYERFLPVSREREALWEVLYILTLVLHSWTKVKPQRAAACVFILENQLRGMGI